MAVVVILGEGKVAEDVFLAGCAEVDILGVERHFAALLVEKPLYQSHNTSYTHAVRTLGYGRAV